MEEDGYIYSKDGKILYYVVPTKQNIEINEKVETIASGAIFACMNLTELEIPDNVVTIEEYALTACPKLETIAIGNGTVNLDSGFKISLYENTDLEIIIDDGNEYYKTENNLILTKDGKEVLTYISKKSTVTDMTGMFYNFSSLTEIKVGTGWTTKHNPITDGMYTNCPVRPSI